MWGSPPNVTSTRNAFGRRPYLVEYAIINFSWGDSIRPEYRNTSASLASETAFAARLNASASNLLSISFELVPNRAPLLLLTVARTLLSPAAGSTNPGGAWTPSLD